MGCKVWMKSDKFPVASESMPIYSPEFSSIWCFVLVGKIGKNEIQDSK